MKKFVFMICVAVLVLSGCNKKEQKDNNGKQIVEKDVLKDLEADLAWDKVVEVMSSQVSYYKLEGTLIKDEVPYSYLAEWTKDNYYMRQKSTENVIVSLIIVEGVHSSSYSNNAYLEQELSTNIKAFFNIDKTQLSDYSITQEDDHYVLSFSRISSVAETKNTYYVSKEGIVVNYTIVYVTESKEIKVEVKDVNSLSTIDLLNAKQEMDILKN